MLRFERNVDVTIALSKLAVYNNFSNILTGVNNSLKIKPGEARDWVLIHFPTGAYSLDDIYDEIVHQLHKSGVTEDVEKNIIFEANSPSLKLFITLRGNYEIDFNVDYSLAPVLGYEPSDLLIGETQHRGSNPVKINKVTNLLILCDITRASYINGKQVSYLFNANMDVEFGVRYVNTPEQLTHIPVLNETKISDMNVWVVDQNLDTVTISPGNRLEIELKISLRYHNILLDASGNVLSKKK